MEATLSVQGMTCGGCAAKVASSLEGVPGVRSAEVSHVSGRAVVALDQPVDSGLLEEAASVGGKYRVSPSGAIADKASTDAATDEGDAPPKSLYPLFLIVGFIAGTTALIALASGQWLLEPMMRHFMAGFFLVFSFFKLLDLRGFVDAYRSYDLPARAFPAWAWVYPFLELGLGVAYLLALAPLVVNGVTLVVMLIGAVGVLKALPDKRAIRCACLGTALNLPMTKVTLVEDLTMAVMAAMMLVVHAI
ncbi:MAG: cation transporter [Planctomycetota bacterium]